jgi:hypothetical protein
METKRCSSCDKDLAKSDFGKNKCRYDGLQGKCKLCDRKAKNNLYAKNRDRYKKMVKDSKRRKLEWFEQYRKDKCCSKCTEKRWYVLDFHHVNEKVDGISSMVNNNVGIDRIIKEIAKCNILCSNCHRELHHFERCKKNGQLE